MRIWLRLHLLRRLQMLVPLIPLLSCVRECKLLLVLLLLLVVLLVVLRLLRLLRLQLRMEMLLQLLGGASLVGGSGVAVTDGKQLAPARLLFQNEPSVARRVLVARMVLVFPFTIEGAAS